MGLRALEALAHGVDGDVGTAELAAPADASGDFLGGAVLTADDHLLAELRDGPAGFLQVMFDARPALGRPLLAADEDEAVADAGGAPIGGLISGSWKGCCSVYGPVSFGSRSCVAPIT